MALTAQQLAYLRTPTQDFRVSVGLFAAYAPTITTPTFTTVTGMTLAPKPIPMISPRKSLIPSSGSITLYATDSYNRGGTYVGNANVAWALDSGGGSLVDNGNGTATYTAPAGSGTAQISMVATNSNGNTTAYAFVQFPKTTYDTIVAEVASISGSLQSGGWTALVRVRGDAGGFTNTKGILLHVDDTWDGTASTFGGYRYSEGLLFGYISQTQYFEDFNGDTWLGVEVVSPMWWLSRMKVGETWWGSLASSNKFIIPGGFAPVDAIWHYVNEITNFSAYHNCTLFFDQNYIDDFAIDQSDLATIFIDVMARTKCVAFCDRYGSLMCIPDPDVRASEWWGTPDPWYTGSEVMNGNDVMDIDITYNPYMVRKLTLEALDASKLGIYAISENSAQMGDIVQSPDGTLICNNAEALASWAVQTRAQMNRAWTVGVTVPLNHIPDLCNFVDVNFVSPQQTNGLTASGRTWIDNIAYRPDIWGGGWAGHWNLLKRTTDDTDGVSSWGQTGFGLQPYTGDDGPGTGWSAQTASATGWCHIFDFVNSGTNSWRIISSSAIYGISGTAGQYVAGKGFSARTVFDFPDNYSGAFIYITRPFQPRYISSVTVWYSGATPSSNEDNVGVIAFSGPNKVWRPINTGFTSTAAYFGGSGGNLTMWLANTNGGTTDPSAGSVIMSAQVCGFGTDPFGSVHTGAL